MEFLRHGIGRRAALLGGAAALASRAAAGQVPGAPFYGPQPSPAPQATTAGTIVTPDQISRSRSAKVIRRIGGVGNSYFGNGTGVGSPTVYPQYGPGCLETLCAYSNGAFVSNPQWILSITGGTTAQFLAAMQAGQFPYSSVDACLIGTCTNDTLAAGWTQAQSIANIQAMVTLCHANGITPVLVTAPPLNSNEGSGSITLQQQREAMCGMNRWLLEYATAHDLPLWDWERAMVDPTSNVGALLPNFTADSIHPSSLALQAAALQGLGDLSSILPAPGPFLPVSQADIFDPVWAPRGNLITNAQLAGSGSAATGFAASFNQTRSGKTQTVAFQSTYPNQGSSADNLGNWCVFTLSGTGTGGTATDGAQIYSAQIPSSNFSVGDTITPACEIVLASQSGSLVGFTLQLGVYNGSGIMIQYSPQTNFGSISATSGPGAGGVGPVTTPLKLIGLPAVIPAGATYLRWLLFVFWNDTSNTAALVAAVRRPTLRKVLASSY